MNALSVSANRICAMMLRYYYILRASPARVIDIMFWPTVQMVMWGFISRFFAMRLGAAPSNLDYALGALLGAVLLWDTLFRTQIAVFIAYLEEIWSRNLGHLFVSPLRAYEWWLSMIIFSVFRVSVGMAPAILLAIPFYGFSIFDLGLPLVFFFFNLLMMGWWLGFMIISILIKAGPGAEGLAWALTFLIAPFCAVYYPVSVLPHWLQPVSLAIPATHVFEGLRALVQDHVFAMQHMWAAFTLNCFYTLISLILLSWAFKAARRAGTLLQSGD